MEYTSSKGVLNRPINKEREREREREKNEQIFKMNAHLVHD